jgi:hypothetical protein
MLLKIAFGAGCRWLTPEILATEEAEIRRITDHSQPRQIVLETPSWKKPITKKGLVEWLKVQAEFKPQYRKKKEKKKKVV